MWQRSLWCVVIVLAFAAAHASEEGGQEKSAQPGFMSRTLRTLNIFRRSSDGKQEDGVVRTKYLTMTLQLSPLPLKLSDTRQLKVAVLLLNKSKKFVHLEFPTTQRIEVLVRDKAGKLVTQWSEDQAFSNVASYAAINPGERIEYAVSVPTRDMAAGMEYTIEAFFPNFDELRVRSKIVPER